MIEIPIWALIALGVGAACGLAVTVALIHDKLQDRRYWQRRRPRPWKK